VIAFLQPLWLLALSAAAIPALLHLRQRQNPPTVVFPAVRYLHETKREHSKRLKLRNLLLMLVVEAILVVLFGFFFNLDLGGVLPALAVVIVLGTVAFAAVGTLFAAMTAQVRARELLFPVLLLPVQAPVLLATVKATEAVLLGEPLGSVAHWLKLLAAADVVYVAVGVLTFDFVLEG